MGARRWWSVVGLGLAAVLAGGTARALSPAPEPGASSGGAQRVPARPPGDSPASNTPAATKPSAPESGPSDKPARRPGDGPAIPALPDFSGHTAMLVVDVLDGRSLVLQGEQGQEIVALLGVEPLAGDASGRGPAAVLRDLALGERVWALDHERGARSDASGRRACYVYRAPDGAFINLEVLRQGYAQASADFAYAHLEVFKAWAAAAKKGGRGLHAAKPEGSAGTSASGPGPGSASGPGGASGAGGATGSGNSEVKPAAIAPSGTTIVYVTRSGTKYHTQTCRFAKSGSPMSLADAQAKKLEPCSQCSPPK